MLANIISAVDQIARTVRSVDWALQLSPNLAGDQQPVSDSMGSMVGQALDLSTSGIIEYGFIVDAIPLVRCYRVQPDAGGPTLDCAKGMGGPVAPIGAYDADTLVAGTHVRFMRLPNSTSGIIIATEPAYMWDPTKCMGDVISQGSNTGLHVETGPQEPFNLGGTQGALVMNGGITDWSGRTPFDSLEIGEFHRTSELGLSIHLDSYMTFMRADECTGIWAFYWDGLLRIAGQNFQEWAGPSEREVYDDEGETMYYHGIATYPWEHMGMVAGPFDVASEQSADDCQNTTPWYGRIEPLHDDLQPFHRYRHYGGYLGQGKKEIICAPVLTGGGGGSFSNEHLYSDCYYMASGLWDNQVMMSGHWGVRTALGLHIAKRPVIPVPKRCEIVTSQEGDTPDNYKASSEYGSGVDHLVMPTPNPGTAESDDEKAWYRNATLMDLHAHLFNWEGLHAFHYHAKDYYIPEENAYDHVDSNQDVPTWSDLDSEYQWYLDVPSYNEIEFDARSGGTAKVYNNTAYFSITDEGGVLIGDGWGSEIRMTGGCIFMECPGDVFLSPGRNLIAWGGRDIILRAWNSVDISASERDVRIKAEQNLNMLAGNGGGPYGMFLETRGTADQESEGGDPGPGEGEGNSKYGWDVVGENAEHTGIVMKAKHSEIVGWARNVYFMTRMDSAALGQATGTTAWVDQPKEGDIVFDTKGQGDIITRSKFVKHWVGCAVMHAFPHSATTRQVNFFTEDGATLCNDLFVDGDLLNWGSHLVKDDVIAASGHFYSSTGGLIGQSNTSSATTAITHGHTYEATLRTWSTERWQVDLQQMWYDANRPGNPAVVASAWFDMRLELDYKSEEFTLWESRWAQMARENSDTILKWTENPVESNNPSEDTFPFPGKDRLTVDSAFKQVTNKLYYTPDGKAVDRGSVYEAPVTLNVTVSSIIDGTFYHIGKS